MQFRIQLTNNHSIVVYRDDVGNIVLDVFNDNHAGTDQIPIASGVERTKEFTAMAGILGD